MKSLETKKEKVVSIIDELNEQILKLRKENTKLKLMKNDLLDWVLKSDKDKEGKKFPGSLEKIRKRQADMQEHYREENKRWADLLEKQRKQHKDEVKRLEFEIEMLEQYRPKSSFFSKLLGNR